MKTKVGFICIHNSCRSQMAEALGKLFASDTFESYSAGTEKVDQINQDAVRIMKDLYDYDMSNQESKLLDTLPAIDIVVTMGCNVNCPFIPAKHREDWGLDDPTGKEDEAFIKTIRLIEEKILDLKKRIHNGTIDLL